MQLSLTTTLPRHPRAAVLRPLVPLSREAAMSQLDQIAAASGVRMPRQDGLGGVSALLAALGGLVLVGAAAMWRGPVDAVPPAASAVSASAAPAVIAAPQPAVTPMFAVAEPQVAAALAAVEPVVIAAETEPATAAPAEPSAEELAQKARVRQLAEARRKAAALAQERLAAEESLRLQAAAQRRETELQAQQAEEQRRQRAAAEAAARQPQVVTVAMTPRRSVRETCGGRGLFAESACLARECARGEHQADAVCVRLRDSDEAQRRASAER